MGANIITVGLSQNSEEEDVRSNGMRFGAFNRNASISEEDRITDDMINELKTVYADSIDAACVKRKTR